MAKKDKQENQIDVDAYNKKIERLEGTIKNLSNQSIVDRKDKEQLAQTVNQKQEVIEALVFQALQAKAYSDQLQLVMNKK